MKSIKSEFLQSIPVDPVMGLLTIVEEFNEVLFRTPIDQADIDFYIAFYVLLEAFCRKHEIKGIQFRSLPSEHGQLVSLVRDTFNDALRIGKASEIAKIEADYRKRLSEHFNAEITYRLSQGDVREIQEAINRLREVITQGDSLGSEHKRRILKRLEALQSEIHKDQSDLDSVIGTMLEVASAIQKVGEAASAWGPIVAAVLRIVFACQSRAYDLPSSKPMPLKLDWMLDNQ